MLSTSTAGGVTTDPAIIASYVHLPAGPKNDTIFNTANIMHYKPQNTGYFNTIQTIFTIAINYSHTV